MVPSYMEWMTASLGIELYPSALGWVTPLDNVLVEKIAMEVCHRLNSPAAFSTFVQSALDKCMLVMALLLVARFLVTREVIPMPSTISATALLDSHVCASCQVEGGPWDNVSSIWLIF